MRPALLLALLLSIFSLFQPAFAQELVWERIGVKDQHRFGGPTIVLGDINADGYPDLLHMVRVKVPRSPGPIAELQLWVLSGKDGRTLRVRPAFAPGRPFYTITAAGDMDGDGVGDYAAIIADQTRFQRPTILEVRSGKNGRLIWKVEGSLASAIVGNLDLDGDKKPDLVVTAPYGTRYGAINAYSNSGKLLYRLYGTAQLALGVFAGGETLGKVGDVDRDGADDFVVGGFDGKTGGGAAVVISGKTGKVLVVGLDEKPYRDGIGHAVDGCGDMDGDGVPDFVGGNAFRPGVVRAFSGKTGKAIHTWTWRTIGDSFELWSLQSGGIDVDRDGVPDVIVGAPGFGSPGPSPGAGFVFSGRDGSVIFVQRNKSGPKTELGAFVTAIGQQPGSPFALFSISEPAFKPFPSGILFAQGRLRVYRGSPAGVEVFGASCRGTLPTYPKVGIRDLGKNGVRITMHDGAPGSVAALFVGLSRTSWGSVKLPMPLYPFGFRGCMLFTSVDVLVVTSTGSTAVSAGYSFLDLPLQLSATGKLTLHGQWLSLGTGTLAPGALSDAIVWRSK